MSVCAYMPPVPLREKWHGWQGGSRAHRGQPPQAVFPGSLSGQVCLLHGCTCPPAQAPSMEGMSQRPPAKCLMSHQTGGERLARLSLNLVSPPSRKHSPSQSRAQQRAAPFPASQGQARMPVQPPPLKDRCRGYHTRPGIRVNSVLRIEAKHEGTACLVTAPDNVLPNHLCPPLCPFRLGPHQCLTHTDDLRRHIYFFIIVS